MGYSGINLENVKLYNRSSILKLLNDKGAMSRKDLAVDLKLTPATVTMICSELLASGVLAEKGEMEEEKRAGRRKVLIDINDRYKYVLSVSIEADDTCMAICSLKGECLVSKWIKTEINVAPEEFLKTIADQCKILMWESGIQKEGLLGMGVSVPGPVQREEGKSLHAYRVWEEPVQVKKVLKERMDIPVVVTNNVRAFAESEMLYGSGKDQKTLLFVKWGPGVGSAEITNGRMYEEEYSKAIELGHYIVEPDGLPCRCGRRGCLETKVSTHSIVKSVQRIFSKEQTPLLYEMMGGNAEKVTVLNRDKWMTLTGDSGVAKVLDEAAERLARSMVNEITLLAPDQIIIFGYMFDIPGIEERLLSYCSHYDVSYTGELITRSELSGKLGYIGPAATVVNELFISMGDTHL